jgi:hypothetical protein
VKVQQNRREKTQSTVSEKPHERTLKSILTGIQCDLSTPTLLEWRTSREKLAQFYLARHRGPGMLIAPPVSFRSSLRTSLGATILQANWIMSFKFFFSKDFVLSFYVFGNVA